ncbi:tropomyosin-2-like [Protopterus annectens]|uniref:tropomyosin-2-like n=1 Tax=Protopterus annectens TaxID=7888 RepID=UPI001CFBFEAF|nr:tropomyosin-2-like [Protopterus annectens]
MNSRLEECKRMSPQLLHTERIEKEPATRTTNNCSEEQSKTMEMQEELIELLEDLDKARDNSKEPLSLQERYERACKEQLFQEVQQSYVMYDCDQVDKWNQEVQDKKQRLAKQILYLRSELEKLRMHLLEKEPPQEIKEEVLLEVEEINERVKQLEEERNKWEKYDEDFEARCASEQKKVRIPHFI